MAKRFWNQIRCLAHFANTHLRRSAFIVLLVMTLASIPSTGASRAILSASEDLIWSFESIGNIANNGCSSSLALDRTGRVHIAYLYAYVYPDHHTDVYINYAYWTGSTWAVNMVNGLGAAGGGCPSLALDNMNMPHISAYGDLIGEIAYARWTGSAWVVQSVERNLGIITGGPVLALDHSGIPNVVYSHTDGINAYLKYARWTGNVWNIETIANTQVPSSAPQPFWYTSPSLVLDSSDTPHISYRQSGTLWYVHWASGHWPSQIVDSVGDVGAFSSIALDLASHPHISYYDIGNADLRYARWTGSAWITQTVDNAGNVGYGTSLALDSVDQPHISYVAVNSGIKYASWTNNGWLTQTVSTGWVGDYTALVLDSADNPRITYNQNNSLWYATGSPRLPLAYTLVPDHSSALDPGQQAIYVHTLQNTGKLTDTYHLTFSSSQHWSLLVASVETGTVQLPTTLSLATDQTAIITVTVKVPTGTAVVGLVDRTIVTATSAISPTLVKYALDTTLIPYTRIYLPIAVRNSF
jgi:hypothetical protein